MTNFTQLKDVIFRILTGNKGAKFLINGIEIRLDESLRRWHYASEQGMLDIMCSKLQKGGGFLDIGANFGLHTLVAAKLVGQDGSVLAVEPLPKNVGYLTKHIKLNHLSNCEIIQGVVSNDSAPELDFFFPDEQFIQTGGLKPSDTSELKTKVRNYRVDDLLTAKTARYDMIKIDVEGAEMDVVISGENYLRKFRPDLLIEIHGFALPGFGYSVEMIRNKLVDMGYKEQLIDSPENREDYFQSFFYANHK